MRPHKEFLLKKNGKEPSWVELVAAANSVLGHQEKLSATGLLAFQVAIAGCRQVELDKLYIY